VRVCGASVWVLIGVRASADQMCVCVCASARARARVRELGGSRRADELMSRSQLLACTRNRHSHTPLDHAHQ